MLNGKVLDKKEYTISELMGQNRKLDVTYGKAGTHTFGTVSYTHLHGAVQEVHLGAADEAGNEHVAGHVVQVLRGIDLLDDAVFHNNDEMCIRDSHHADGGHHGRGPHPV